LTERFESAEAVCITGMGMVTSLGLDVKTSCAAARAGIVRSAEIDYFPVRSPDDGSVSGLVVHAAPMITDGFEGDARLLRLMAAALSDLRRQTPDGPWGQGKTAFYLSLPDPLRTYTGTALIADEKERGQWEEDARAAAERPPDESRPRNLLLKSARLSDWPGEPKLRFVSTSGNTGVAEALSRAMEDMAKGAVDTAVVGGVDSFCGAEMLAWLDSTGRLKTPDLPAGLQPGEGGAFIAIEALRGVRARKGSSLATIQATRLGSETRTLLSGEPPLGEGLTSLLQGVPAGGQTKGGKPWFITDQNGEPYRAMEWGYAVVRLIRDWPGLHDAVLWYPAISFGDTGAAFGAVAVCMAVRAYERAVSPDARAIVVSSSDSSNRSVVVLQQS